MQPMIQLRCAYFFFMFLITNAFLVVGQWNYSGRVLDAESKRPVPFANLALYQNGLVGGSSTNLDGAFELKFTSAPDSVVVSCVGYERLVLPRFDAAVLWLAPRETRLEEILILPGENPALRIIRNVIKNAGRNDVEQTETFSYEAYTLFNADIETLDTTKFTQELDSATRKALEFFRFKQAFVTETHSRFHYKPKGNRNELIVASKTSGMKNPFFSLFSNQIQPFSAYVNPIELFATEYLNPLSESGLKGYFYILQDSIFQENDTIFVIDFHPKLNSTFSGARGTVYVNASDWSINKMIFNFPNPFNMALGSDDDKSTLKTGEEIGRDNFATIIIHYVRVQERRVPIEVRTIYPMGNLRPEVPMNIYNTSYFANYRFGADAVEVKTMGASVRITNDASMVDEETWRIIRGARQSDRIDSTYLYMDSLSKIAKFDRLTAMLLAALEGKLKLSVVDIDLNKTLTFNEFEGLRLGLGLETNERILKFMRVGGFFGYGFKDKAWKYGGHARFILYPMTQLQAIVSYGLDVRPTGIPRFIDPSGRIDQGEWIRNAYVRQMDYVKELGFGVSSYLYKSMHLKLHVASKDFTTGYDYVYAKPGSEVSGSQFSLFETQVDFNWRIRDKYIQLGTSRLTLNEPKLPIIQVQWTRGWDNIWNGQYAYDRLAIQVSQQFRWLRTGQLSARATYQKTLGEVPLPLLIYTPGILDRRFGVGAMNVFETIRPNEFLNDELLACYLRFNFNPWVWKKNVLEPLVSLRFNAGVGWLKNPEYHQGVSFSTMERGFYETGIVFERLYKAGFAGYGLGFYYRIGPYQMDSFWSNFAVKLTLSLGQ